MFLDVTHNHVKWTVYLDRQFNFSDEQHTWLMVLDAAVTHPPNTDREYHPR